jgi:hypothetical protein
VKDFQRILTVMGWPEAASTVVAVRQPCITFEVNRLLQQPSLHARNDINNMFTVRLDWTCCWQLVL